MLKKDNIGWGMLVGLLCPSVLLGLLWLLSTFFAPEGKSCLIPFPTLLLLSIIPNLFILRYYLLKLQFDRTGRGILLLSFLWAILFFVIYMKS
ncbi:MAG: hypothetical protein LBC89_02730 [Bacteroidales bacterium]|nr:hypothetical protein [Bacteroidales bacterium]